jgi:hypothetical protein
VGETGQLDLGASRAAHCMADDMRLHRCERHVRLVSHVLVQTCPESISGSLQQHCSTAEDTLSTVPARL